MAGINLSNNRKYLNTEHVKFREYADIGLFVEMEISG